jgi:hypothetical protein
MREKAVREGRNSKGLRCQLLATVSLRLMLKTLLCLFAHFARKLHRAITRLRASQKLARASINRWITCSQTRFSYAS